MGVRGCWLYASLALGCAGGCSFDPTGSAAPGGTDADAAIVPLPDASGSGRADAAPADGPVTPSDAVPADAALRACADDAAYQLRPGARSRYRIVQTAATWPVAEVTCAGEEAYLAVIDDRDENDYVRSLEPSRLWIGLTDRAQEDVFEWISGDPLEFENWAAGEPNDGGFGAEDCAEMRVDGLWNDEGCGTSLRYVCECGPTRGERPLDDDPVD